MKAKIGYALLLGAFCAPAATTVATFTISSGGITASGTLTLTPTSDPAVDQITGITGTFTTTSGGFSGAITGLNPASYSSSNPTVTAFSEFDNLFYPTGMAPALKGHPAGGMLDDNGLDFMVAGGYTVNVFERGATSGFILTDGLNSTLDMDVNVNMVITLPVTPVLPAITKVANAEGEALTIAPNTWVEIKGTNLAPTGVSSPACAPGYLLAARRFPQQPVAHHAPGRKRYVERREGVCLLHQPEPSQHSDASRPQAWAGYRATHEHGRSECVLHCTSPDVFRILLRVQRRELCGRDAREL